jgi:hypothetical protein
MKICPFMSHMLGADGNALEIDAAAQHTTPGNASDVVVLGYDGDGGVGVADRGAPRARRRAASRAQRRTLLPERNVSLLPTDDGVASTRSVSGPKRAGRPRRTSRFRSRVARTTRKTTRRRRWRANWISFGVPDQECRRNDLELGEVEKRQAKPCKLKTDVEALCLLVPTERGARAPRDHDRDKDGIAETRTHRRAQRWIRDLTTTVSTRAGLRRRHQADQRQWTIMARIATIES